jgi:hypothetical protein
MKMGSVETKPAVQESIGIFQLINQLETAVDTLLERQVINNAYYWSAIENCRHTIGKASGH